MKLKMAQEGRVSILEVSEAVSKREVLILKTGIVNLLKQGKNKIVINLVHAASIDILILQEIAAFQQLAQELNGEVVAVGKPDIMLAAMRGLMAKNPKLKLRSYSTKEAAIESLSSHAEGSAIEKAKANTAELKTELAKLESEVAVLEKHANESATLLKLERELAMQKAYVLYLQQLQQWLSVATVRVDTVSHFWSGQSQIIAKFVELSAKFEGL